MVSAQQSSQKPLINKSNFTIGSDPLAKLIINSEDPDILDFLPKWCKESLINGPFNYRAAIRKFSAKDQENFIKFVNAIDKLGVMGFGYRCFWKNGETSIFALSEDWNTLDSSNGFKQLHMDYIKAELIYAATNNINVLTRTRDKIEHEYLKKLNTTSVNNGIVIYNYSQTRIEVFYFNCSNPNDRDFLLNKLGILQNLINECKSVFKNIIDCTEMQELKKICLNKEQKYICFKDNSFNNKTIAGLELTIKGRSLKLSSTDVECLQFLYYGGSIKQIASCIGRSVHATKDRIDILKIKLDVDTKEGLILLVRNEMSFLIRNLINKK